MSPRFQPSETSGRARQARTLPGAHRHGQPWTAEEDAELAQAVTDDELEAFAVRWERRYLGVVQRRRRPRGG